jgi:hypothetical protein
VKPADAVAFASGAGVLFAVALIACYLPAARAARIKSDRRLQRRLTAFIPPATSFDSSA